MKSHATIIKVLTKAFELWGQHRGARVAAALAYYSVFALAPLTFMMVVVNHFVLRRGHGLGTIESELQPLLGGSGTRGIDVLVRASAHQVSTAPIVVGAILVLIAGVAIFMQIQEALDDIWGIPEHRRGSIWDVVRLRLHVLILFGALALFALIALFVAFSAARPIAYGVNIIALITLLALAYHVLPNAKVSFKNSILGALVTGAILVCGELVIAFYFNHFHPETAYGAAGSFVIVLLWIYFSMQFFLFGALLTRVLESMS